MHRFRASHEDVNTFLAQQNSINETILTRCQNETMARMNSTSLLPLSSEQYIYIYSALIFGLIIVSLVRAVVFRLMLTRSSFTLHSRMFRSVIKTPVLFFDRNPVGEDRKFFLFMSNFVKKNF